MTAKELSGVFTDTEKWIEAFDLLAKKDCSVEQLRIYHNSPEQLEATAKALHGNICVRTFEVGAAAGVGSQALAELLKVNSSICNLTVQSLPTADDVAAVASGLSCCKSLQTVTFHSLTAQDVARISAALSNSSSAGTLQQLHLSKCRLDVAAAAALHKLLLLQPSLTVLNLQEACFEHPTTTSSSSSRASTSSTAAAPCFSLPSSNSSSSTDNSTSSHDTSTSTEPASPPSPASAAVQLFTAALAAHPSLLRLDLSKSTGLAADYTGVQQLGAYLATAPHLQEVMLAEAGLGETAAQQLAAALLQSSCESGAAPTSSTQGLSHGESGVACRTQATRLHASSGPSSVVVSNVSSCQTLEGLARSGIRVLDVSGNRVGPVGATALGGALGACCSKLAVLRLSGNELRSHGLAGLCAGLSEGCCQVAELDVSGNQIKGSTGLTAFLGSPAACHLTTLNLANNCLNDEAATELAAALIRSSLACLDLSQNWIGDAGANALASMLQAHTSMSRIQLQKNRIRRPGIDALVDAALANQVVQDLRLEGNRAVDRMSKMTLDDLARALVQRRHGLGSSRRSSAATATTVSGDGTCCGSSRSSSRRASNTALAATDCTSEASGSILNSRSVSTDAAAAAIVTVGACSEGELSDVGGVAVYDNVPAAAVALPSTMALPSTTLEYNQDEIIMPRARKVARLSDSSSNDGTAAAGGGNCTAPVSPFATGSSAAAAAATVDPTTLFQVPLGFADRLVQRRSYSFEYWFQPRATQPATGSTVSSTGSGAFVEPVHRSSQQGSNERRVNSSRIVTSAVDGAAMAATKAEIMLQSAELGHFPAAEVANHNSNSACAADSNDSRRSTDVADLSSGQGMADGFPASLLGVLGPGDVDRAVHLTDAKAASLSGWLLDDCCAAKLVLPDLTPGVVRRGSSSRQDSMGRYKAAALWLGSVCECDSELLSLSPSEGNSGASVGSRNVAVPGPATSGVILGDSSVATSCNVMCPAVGPVVMLRGIRTCSGSVGCASRSSSRYVSCSTSSSDGADSCCSSSCGSSRSGSPRAAVRRGVRKLGTGHLVVQGSVGGGGLSRFAKPVAGSAAPDSC